MSSRQNRGRYGWDDLVEDDEATGEGMDEATALHRMRARMQTGVASPTVSRGLASRQGTGYHSVDAGYGAHGGRVLGSGGLRGPPPPEIDGNPFLARSGPRNPSASPTLMPTGSAGGSVFSPPPTTAAVQRAAQDATVRGGTQITNGHPPTGAIQHQPATATTSTSRVVGGSATRSRLIAAASAAASSVPKAPVPKANVRQTSTARVVGGTASSSRLIAASPSALSGNGGALPRQGGGRPVAAAGRDALVPVSSFSIASRPQMGPAASSTTFASSRGSECQMLLAMGSCEYGQHCRFSHDEEELRRRFPDAPMFTDPAAIAAYHDFVAASAGLGTSAAETASSASSANSDREVGIWYRPIATAQASSGMPTQGRGRGGNRGHDGGRGRYLSSDGYDSDGENEDDLEAFTNAIFTNNAHRLGTAASRTGNPWLAGHGGARSGGAGRGRGRGSHNDPYFNLGGGRFRPPMGNDNNNQYEGGVDLDNMGYEEILAMQEANGGDVPTPLPTNVLQSFPMVQYGTPAYLREVKAVLSAIRSLRTPNPSAAASSGHGTQRQLGARPSSAINVEEDDENDTVAGARLSQRTAEELPNAPNTLPNLPNDELSPDRPQQCLICFTSVAKEPCDDDDSEPEEGGKGHPRGAGGRRGRAPFVRVLLCGHEFHSDCILEWFKLKSTCPICKQDLNALHKRLFGLDDARPSNRR